MDPEEPSITARKIPDGLKDELIEITSVIRNELDKPFMELWGCHRLVNHDRPGALFSYVVSAPRYLRPRIREGRTKWFFNAPEIRIFKKLNNMAEDHSVEDIYQYAMRSITGNNLGRHRVDYADYADNHKLHSLQLNAVLEYTMGEIERLRSENEELKLRPPGVGGDAYLAAKEHWDSLT